MRNISTLTFTLLWAIPNISCSQPIQEYVFSPTSKSCLFHLILHTDKRQAVNKLQNQELELDSLVSLRFRSLIILLSISYNSGNISSAKQDDEEDEDGENSSSSSHKNLVIESKWRGGQCLRIFILNAKTFLDILHDPHVKFWGYSERAEIFAFVPIIHGPGDFDSLINSKESGNFHGFRANLVIVSWEKDISSNTIVFHKLGMLCYVCHSEASIKWMDESSFQDVPKLYKKLKRNGNNRKLFMKYGVDLTNYEEDGNCESRMFFHKTKECGITTIIVQMTKSALNLTVERVMDLEDVDDPISAHINILPQIPRDTITLGNDKITIFFREQTIGKLFYCTDSAKFEPISWNFFFRVVEPVIWGCIFMLGIVYAIITRSPYLGIRALLFLVGQGIPAQLSRKKILLTPLLPLILVSNWYISILTMDVVVPPAIWVVTKNRQLFDIGFKFLIPSLSSLPVVRQKANRSLEKFGIPWDPTYFVARPDIIQFGQELQPEFFLKLGAVNGIYHTNVDVVRYMRRLKLLHPRNSRYGNVTCSVVQEDWDDQIKYFWILDGYLSPQIVEIASRFVEMGFNYFWTMKKHFNTVSNMQISRYCQAHTQVCGSDDVSKMAMHSSIQIIFYFLLALSILSFLIFVIEIFTKSRQKYKIGPDGV